MQDFYEVLGIDKGASQAQIKAAFKKLAMKYHPDRNPGNKQAEEMFKILNEAYHTLSHPEKKLRYDSRFYWVKEEPVQYSEAYWQEMRRKRYERWMRAQENRYRFDKNYFKIQGLAFLVFIIIAGFCFGIIHTAHYYVERKYRQKWNANSQSLKQVNGLFGEGRFDDAFKLISVLEEKDPLEYRFEYARDSLVSALRKIADQEFEEKQFTIAVAHYSILKNHEQPARQETLENLSLCQYYMGNFEESLQSLKHLHSQQPYNLALIYQIGVINLEKLNDPQEALQYFTLGKKIFKENLGSIYGKAFELVMNPADAPDIYYHIFRARAITNLKLKNYKDAETDCNWAIFLRAMEGDPYLLRAVAKLNQRYPREVCEDLGRALQQGLTQADMTTQARSLQRKYCR